MHKLHQRHLYLCTPLRDDLGRFIPDVLRGGVDILQLREKDAEVRDLIRAAREIALICADFDVPFIINDRPDIALEIGADGVHVGQDDLSVETCRKILGPNAIVGLSTHGIGDLADAQLEETSYLSAGPVEATPTKPGRPGTGSMYAAVAQQRTQQPVFVTGGIRPEKIQLLVDMGIRHFVVVRYITQSADPFRATQRLRDAIDTAISEKALTSI